MRKVNPAQHARSTLGSMFCTVSKAGRGDRIGIKQT